MLSQSIRRFVSFLVVTLLVLGTYQLAAAHAHLERSEPEVDGTVSSSPEFVTLYFSQELDAGKSSVTVVDPSGTTVSRGATTLLEGDNKAMQVALPPNLSGAVYTVNWVATSAADGDETTGSYNFTVAPGGTAAQGSGMPAPSQLPQTGVATAPTGALMMLAGAALVLAGLAVLRALARRQVPDSAGSR